MSSDCKDCLFTQEEQTLIIFELGRLQSVIKVRRSCRNYFKKAPYQVPRYNAFFRLVSSLSSTGSCKPDKPQGKTVAKTIKENAEKIKALVESKSRISCKEISAELNISQHQYRGYLGSI